MKTFYTDTVRDFIYKRFLNIQSEQYWTDENSYYFALILKDRFPSGTICYAVEEKYFVFLRDGVYYSYSGIVLPTGTVVQWDNLFEYNRNLYDEVLKKFYF